MVHFGLNLNFHFEIFLTQMSTFPGKNRSGILKHYKNTWKSSNLFITPQNCSKYDGKFPLKKYWSTWMRKTKHQWCRVRPWKLANQDLPPKQISPNLKKTLRISQKTLSMKKFFLKSYFSSHKKSCW